MTNKPACIPAETTYHASVLTPFWSGTKHGNPCMYIEKGLA